jgi:hypothetical protein
MTENKIMVMQKSIIEIVENNMAENIYQALKDTDFAKNALNKYPHFKNDLESFAKQIAQGGIDSKLGKMIDYLLKIQPIPGFKKACQRALERGILRTLTDWTAVSER